MSQFGIFREDCILSIIQDLTYLIILRYRFFTTVSAYKGLESMSFRLS